MSAIDAADEEEEGGRGAGMPYGLVRAEEAELVLASVKAGRLEVGGEEEKTVGGGIGKLKFSSGMSVV